MEAESLPEKVFVVHGRNLAAKDATFSFLRALRLEPLEWEQAVALTQQASPTILEVVKAGFEAAQCIVVLMTGDDVARLRPELGNEPLLNQPRPNVLFEAGWAIGIAGNERTILLRFGDLRELSDLSGVNMLEIDNSPTKRTAFVQRLRTAGCEIKDVGSDYLRPEVAGDFELMLEGEAAYEVLERGGFTDFVVDSSLSHSLNNLDLFVELYSYLSQGGPPSLKYNYMGAMCAQNWLALSQDPTYGHSELTSMFRTHAREIVAASELQGREVDFVSLGPGDGLIDIDLLFAFQQETKLVHYYPLDLSFELLQKTVSTIVNTKWLQKGFRMKAIHGDFIRLNTYKPIFGYDPAINFISLIGNSLGNHNEAELLGKLREGMEPGDFLLVDARLHQVSGPGRRPSKSEFQEIAGSYNHGLNNRFAFGPVEAATIADFNSTQFLYEVNSQYTAIPNALNVVTYCENLKTRFRRDNRKLVRKRLDLAVTTLYDAESLAEWLPTRGFQIVWQKRDKKTAVFLLRKPN